MAIRQMLSCQAWRKRSFLRRLVLPKLRSAHKLQISGSAHKLQAKNAQTELIGVTVLMAILSVYGVTE
jgi:hypothetical protein